MPTTCPFCASRNLCTEMVEWKAQSMEPMDSENTAVLSEHQCNDCAKSFWS